MKITKTIDKTIDLIAALNALASREVLVGIPAEDTNRAEGSITNAALGYIHEHGAPEVNIPARPHLKIGVRNAHAAIVGALRGAGRAALAGNPGAVLRGLGAAGLAAQNSVRRKITDGPFAPLAPATIAARRRSRRGRRGPKK